MDVSQHSDEIITLNDHSNNNETPLSKCVKVAVDEYFSHLNGHDGSGLHALVITEVEKPLIEAALEYSGYNQTKAAKVLGISRSTLRKKMDQYNID